MENLSVEARFSVHGQMTAVHGHVQIKLLSVHTSAATYTNGCGNSSKKQTPNINKGVSIGPS